jgi:DNA polymerase III delta prime subunit
VFENLKNIKHLHHAYFVPSVSEETLLYLEKILNEFGVQTRGTPDYIVWKGETFGVDDARDIKRKQGVKNFSGKQCFIIYATTITLEAQNALLKVLEEPTPETHFFICIPHEGTLLPTLLSRMVVLSTKRKEQKGATALAFLKGTPGERLKFLEKEILGKDKDEIERSEILSFLNLLEKEISDAFHKNEFKTRKEVENAVGAIYSARSLISKNQGSAKLLLENIALITPSLV